MRLKENLGNWAVIGTVPIALSDLLGVVFPPVMVNNNRSENHRRDKNHQKKYSELIHSYSPLSKIYPMNNSTKNKTMPITNAAEEILSGVAILPITSAMKTAWLKLKTTLPKFSLLRFVNLIKGIIQQATGFVKRTSRGRELKEDFKRRAVIGTVPITLSDLLGVFFPPVLMNNNRRHNNAEKHCAAESNVVSHIYSPLSKIVPIIMKSIQKIIPKISFGTSNSFVTKEPKITIAKIKLAALKKALAKFSRCFFVNLIKGIIQPATGFVKRT